MKHPALTNYLDPLASPLRGGLDRSENGDYALVEADSGTRAPIEAFIRHHYAKCFDARIDAFMPRLFGLRGRDGSLCGAFGLRTTCGKLFLEQYLQGAIESAIATCCGHAVERTGIVEIGHFSGSAPGAARAMIRLLTRHLYTENFTWVAFTGTRALRNAFSRMHLPLLDIAAADITHLPGAARAHWGTYYKHAPRVMAGEIQRGYAALTTAAATPATMERCA